METEMTDQTSRVALAAAGQNPFAGLFAPVARMVRAVRREMEIARAQRALSDMSDAMLRDMGIDRYEIDLAARFGRDHGRRYL